MRCLSNFLPMALIASLVAFGCESSDDGGTAAANTAPSASGLTFTPSSAAVGQSVTMSGSLQFADPDGNLSTLYIRFQNPDGTSTPASPTPIADAAGKTAGAVPFAFAVTPTLAGEYTVEMWLEDSAKAVSTTLSGKFTATDGAAGAAPTLSALSYAPQAGVVGTAVDLTGTVKVADADSDAATWHAEVSPPSGAAFPAVSGAITGGDAAFAVSFTPIMPGTYTLSVTAKDAAGNTSAAVTGTINVTEGVTPGNSAPTVKGLTFEPSTAELGASVKVTGSFTAEDVDGNLKTQYVRIKRPDGTSDAASSGLISGPSGQTSATINVNKTFDADTAGTYTVEVWVSDTEDAESAVLTGTIEVAAPSPIPTVDTLEFNPKTAKTTIKAFVNGSLKWTDGDGDPASLETRIKQPDGTYAAELSKPLINLGSKFAGAAQFSFDFTATQVGDHQLQAFLKDEAGNLSNVLEGTITVTDGGPAVNQVPVVSDLTLTDDTVTVGANVSYAGSFTATDADGDLSTWLIVLKNPDGSVKKSISGVVPGASGQTSATIPFNTSLALTIPGDYDVEASVKDDAGAISNVATTTLTVEAVVPSAPTATLIEVTPSSAKTGLTVTYNGKVGFKDADGDVTTLRVRIRRPDLTWEQTAEFPIGSLVSKYAGSALFSLPYLAGTAGEYTVEGWIVDATGKESNALQKTVTVTAPLIPNNELPTASALIVEPETGFVGTFVELTGSFTAADLDGDLATHFVRVVAPSGNAFVTAEAAIGGPVGTLSAAVPVSYAFIPTELGLHTVEAWCEDDAGAASNVTTAIFDVVPTLASAPVLSSFSVPSIVATVGVQVNVAFLLSYSDDLTNAPLFQVRARRPDGSHAWITQGHVNVFPSANAPNDTFSLPYKPSVAGTHVIELWAIDAEGNLSNVVTGELVVTSVPGPQNSVPLASALSFAPTSAFNGQATLVTGTLDVADVDENLATLHLRFKKPSGQGLTEQSSPLTLAAPSGGEASFAIAVTPDMVGNWTLEAYAKDTSGAKSTTLTGTLAVTAPPSTVPVSSGVSFTPTTATAGEPTTFTGAVAFTDADGDLASVHVRFKRPGNSVSSETIIPYAGGEGEAPFSVTFTGTVGGTYTLEAWVKDQKGQKSNTVTGTVEFSASPVADNTPPVLQDLTFSPTVATSGTPVSLVGSVFATDLDSNWASIHYRFRRPNGTTLPEAKVTVSGLSGKTSGSISFTRPVTPDAAGVWQLEVYAKDAAGESSAITAGDFTVAALAVPSETAPSIVKLTVQPLTVIIDKEKTFTGSVQVTDADGNADFLTIALVDPTGAPLPETAITLDGFDGDTAFTADFTMPFTAEMVGDYTLEAWVTDLEGQESAIAAATVVAFDLSNVNSACAALETDCTGQGFCYDVNSTTCEYLAEKQLEWDVCDTVGPTGTVAACVSSIEDTSSPYASTAANCSFVQYWSNPTVFPIDCRCGDAAFEAPCKRPYELSSVVTFGKGPRPRDLATEMRLWNGPVYGREWFVPAFWKTSSKPNQTMIYAIHLDTGDRRYFSGTYNDPANGLTRVGTGPDFVQVMDMKVGPDGQFYAVGAASEISEPKIWRVDPATGNRTLIFDAATAPASALCPNGSTLPGLKTVQMAAQGWAMDSQGRFYFSMVNQPGPSIVRISADGTACDYVTSVVDVPSNSRENVGGGYDDFQFDFRAFEIRDPDGAEGPQGEKLYAVSNNMFLVVDIATGNRSLISKGTDVGNIGAGPINAEAFGDRWTRWDPYRNVYWTVGALGGSSAVTVDPTTGYRATWPCWHPSLGGPLTACGGTGKALIPGYLNFGGFVIDPEGDHNLYFAHDTMAIVKYDVKTGNAYTFSL